MPTRPDIKVSFEHPSNTAALRYLGYGPFISLSGTAASCSPQSVRSPYMSLGTHPDLVSRLWDEITTALPCTCAWVLCDTPVLVRPDTGIIFGVAGGTHTYALRLPPKERSELAAQALQLATENADKLALRGPERDRYIRTHTRDNADGANFHLPGSEWAFCLWKKQDADLCLAAYEYAAT